MGGVSSDSLVPQLKTQEPIPSGMAPASFIVFLSCMTLMLEVSPMHAVVGRNPNAPKSQISIATISFARTKLQGNSTERT